MNRFPTGKDLPAIQAKLPGASMLLEGEFVRLERPAAERVGGDLFDATHGGEQDEGQWTYMTFGPFRDAADMTAWIQNVLSCLPATWAFKWACPTMPTGASRER